MVLTQIVREELTILITHSTAPWPISGTAHEATPLVGMIDSGFVPLGGAGQWVARQWDEGGSGDWWRWKGGVILSLVAPQTPGGKPADGCLLSQHIHTTSESLL